MKSWEETWNCVEVTFEPPVLYEKRFNKETKRFFTTSRKKMRKKERS